MRNAWKTTIPRKHLCFDYPDCCACRVVNAFVCSLIPCSGCITHIEFICFIVGVHGSDICAVAKSLCNCTSVVCVFGTIEAHPSIVLLAALILRKPNACDDDGGSSTYHFQHLERTSNHSLIREHLATGFEKHVNGLTCRIANLEPAASELVSTLNKLRANLETARADVGNLRGTQAQHAESSSDELQQYPSCERGQFQDSSSDALAAPIGLPLHAPPAPPGLPVQSAPIVPSVPWFVRCGVKHGEGHLIEGHCSFLLPISVRLHEWLTLGEIAAHTHIE